MNLNEFLTCGCFLALPKLNKVFISSHFEFSDKLNENEICFYKNNFFLGEKKPWLISKNTFEMSFHEFSSLILTHLEKKPILNWITLDIEKYKLQFNSLKNEIEKENFIKGVPFVHQSTSHKVTRQNLTYFLQSLFQKESFDNLYLYGYWNFNLEEGFLGASPELLFTQNKNQIQTDALAGTVENNKLFQKDDEKILREHNLVIEGIQKNLNPYGYITTEKTTLLKLETFSHLKSTLKLTLNHEFNFEQILSALHPTPALGTFPKQEGLEWLKLIEENIEKRFFYCNPFGLYLNQNFSICIGVIRCLQWNNHTLFLTAGGGVIKESEFKKEWEEIKLKLNSIKTIFKL